MNMEEQLMHQLKRACAALRRHPRGPEGQPLPPPRGFGHILALLSREDGISQQQIAERLGIRPQSVSEAVTLLEERGYVLKEASPTDRRVTLVFLTVAGLIHAEQLAEERKLQAQRFFSVLDEAEKQQLLQLLCKVNEERGEG
ncbi:MAG: MarR family transcriptional regulator [Clostridia bacterium]|nr:MarR family transcriptional regulator [Clostridia bacterium]